MDFGLFPGNSHTPQRFCCPQRDTYVRRFLLVWISLCVAKLCFSTNSLLAKENKIAGQGLPTLHVLLYHIAIAIVPSPAAV